MDAKDGRRTACAAVVTALVGLLGGPACGWYAAGTVRSSGGTLLSGVAVGVRDSAVSTVTDSLGRFAIGSSRAVGIAERAVGGTFSAGFAGDALLVRSSVAGPLDVVLTDGLGRPLWKGEVQAGEGCARIDLPHGLRAAARIVQVRSADGTLLQDAAATARTVAGRPVLTFRKAGFADTSWSATADSVIGLAVVLRDTTDAATCPAPRLAAGDYTRTVTVGAATRSYVLHVPSAYKGDTGVPLVVDFHPIGGTALGEEGASPYRVYADEDGAVSAYPDGVQSPNRGQAWDVGPCCTVADDTSFVRALVADVEKSVCVDRRRVYAVGYSMGGGMTHYSACHLADVFAALAPAAFDLLQENQDACRPSRPVSVMIFRSTGDYTVPYAGGSSDYVEGMPIHFLGAQTTFAKWAALDGCTGAPSAEDANGCSTYSNCKDGVRVTLCTKQGGGHDYGNATVGWPFLKTFTLP